MQRFKTGRAQDCPVVDFTDDLTVAADLAEAAEFTVAADFAVTADFAEVVVLADLADVAVFADFAETPDLTETCVTDPPMASSSDSTSVRARTRSSRSSLNIS